MILAGGSALASSMAPGQENFTLKTKQKLGGKAAVDRQADMTFLLFKKLLFSIHLEFWTGPEHVPQEKAPPPFF